MHTNEIFLKEFAKRADMRVFTPSLYRFLVDYLDVEKVRPYNDQYVINTFIPPFPGPAFDRFMATFFANGKPSSIQAVDLAVTNACIFNCWHCYNAGRQVSDLSTEALVRIVRELQDLGAMVINFTGGEPCLRSDLIEICSALRPDSCGILATTGYGFTDELAERLSDTGVYSVSVSLDSADEKEHDRRRGVPGAFKIAMKGIETALKYGFYTYTCAVPSKQLLEEDQFSRLVELNRRLGISELQLIEPAPAGKIVSAHLDFGPEEFSRVLEYMRRYNAQDNGLALSSFAHMESPECFGCGAGRSHIYIDGTGEVSPCNMIPVSYGNAAKEDLADIVERLQQVFTQPYCTCLAYSMQAYFSSHCKKCKPVSAERIPTLPVPQNDRLPRFFELIAEQDSEISGAKEIVTGYSVASETYDDYWLSIASEPIRRMFSQFHPKVGGKAVDCGCGTGFATALLAGKVGPAGHVTGIDLTAGMINKAEQRMERVGISNVDFVVGNVLEELAKMAKASFDAATLSWLIGYVGCEEMFPLLRRVLQPGGIVGFVAHLDRSPEVPIEVFEEVVREHPEALTRAVQMKFPLDAKETMEHLKNAGFDNAWLAEGSFDFVCHSGVEVFDHVMKSGAGSTLYYALKASMRDALADEFIERIEKRYADKPEIRIGHRYVIGIARSA